ncbi:hypothetical protein CCP3SC15_210030 [Gammaproteobacteria bacterium]
MKIEIRPVVNGFLIEINQEINNCPPPPPDHPFAFMARFMSHVESAQYIAKNGDEVQAVLKTLFLEQEVVKK